jgi:hypothetical protein
MKTPDTWRFDDDVDADVSPFETDYTVYNTYLDYIEDQGQDPYDHGI